MDSIEELLDCKRPRLQGTGRAQLLLRPFGKLSSGCTFVKACGLARHETQTNPVQKAPAITAGAFVILYPIVR